MLRPKKYYGQHFLKDENIARKIVDSLSENTVNVLEIGPGLGVLTKHILEIENINVIGNFPYNISSQILFKVMDHRSQIKEVVGMFQKEVAERVVSPPGNKRYGILSVLVQAFYNVELLFTVNENVFYPPPKVKSAVIRMKRNQIEHLTCDEKLFFSVVKTAFNQRRKTLRNALKPLNMNLNCPHSMLDQRAEQLTVHEFIELTNSMSPD